VCCRPFYDSRHRKHAGLSQKYEHAEHITHLTPALMYHYTTAIFISFNNALLLFHSTPDSGPGSSPKEVFNITCYISRMEYKAKISTSRRKTNEYLGPSLPSVTRTRVGRKERSAPRERNESEDVQYLIVTQSQDVQVQLIL
jgi:hypothetical protein